MKKILIPFLFFNSCANLNTWTLEDKIVNKLSKNKESYLTEKCEIHKISLTQIDELRKGIEIEFHFTRNDSTYYCIERYTNKYLFFDSELKYKNVILRLKTSY